MDIQIKKKHEKEDSRNQIISHKNKNSNRKIIKRIFVYGIKTTHGLTPWR